MFMLLIYSVSWGDSGCAVFNWHSISNQLYILSNGSNASIQFCILSTSIYPMTLSSSSKDDPMSESFPSPAERCFVFRAKWREHAVFVQPVSPP